MLVEGGHIASPVDLLNKTNRCHACTIFASPNLHLAESRVNDLQSLKDRFPALDLRLGTVDRFQGMERAVIIVSTVRNNERGDIGFARAPERINVAFSRAQELLVVVGCLEMFTNARGRNNEALKARESYQEIAKLLTRQPEGKLIRVPDEFAID